MNKVVVISGVAGMTGSMVAKSLMEQGIRVIGFDNFFCGSRKVVAELEKNELFKFFEFDINDKVQMDSIFAFARSQHKDSEKWFINCAAVVHTKYFYHPDDTFATNVVAMKDMLERCIADGYTRYINCSTSEVYSMKSWEEGGVHEGSPVLMATAEQSLRTSYATGKLLTEFFMKDAVEQGRIKGCSMRFANVYSAEEIYDDHIIPHIISSLKKNGGVTLLENAKETRRTFLNNEDSCRAVVELLMNESALDGGVYNVGTMEEFYIVDLVKLIAKMMGIENPRIDFRGVRSADPRRRLLSVEKIQKAVGWVAKVDLRAGLKACIQNRMARD